MGGRHNATNNAGYTIGQTVTGVAQLTGYDFAGWVNVPNTTDSFSVRFEIVWRTGTNAAISTQTITTVSAQTPGWMRLAGTYTAPAGASRATINMVVTSLNATVNVDDFALR